MKVLIRGGGDLASGVALRLHRAGIPLLITEIEFPLAVRRRVAFSEAVYTSETIVEGVRARLAKNLIESQAVLDGGSIPVLVDPELQILKDFTPLALVDARMLKLPVPYEIDQIELIIGLGPGFTARENCHAAIETRRGHTMGRVLWKGAPEADTAEPEGMAGVAADRVLRAPKTGIFESYAEIGEQVEEGDLIGNVNETPLVAPFAGVIRGLVRSGMVVEAGMKIGDLDPRGVAAYSDLVSDKALAVGGGVLESLLTRDSVRNRLWPRT